MRITAQKGFSGVDERKKLCDGPAAASSMKNFRITAGGSIEKRPNIAKACNFIDDIRGIWSGSIGNQDIVIVASNELLYKLEPNKVPTAMTLLGGIGTGECMIFEFGGAIYVKTDSFYGKYDGTKLSKVEGYIPCVAMSCEPSGEGELFEQINLLSDKRRQLFSGNGTSVLYRLAEKDIDGLESLKINGVEYSGNYSVEKHEGYLSFEVAPPEGLNNIEAVYIKAIPEADRNRILKCSKIMLFGGNSDGRAFLWGNPEYPNYRFYSDLADGIPSVEYFPVNAFTVIGNSKINCIVQQYDRQLIFTKNEAYYSFSELTDDGLGNTVSSFPVYSLNNGKGCLIETEGCVIDNRPVTLCDDGLNMWESTSVENEKNAVCFSAAINETLREIMSGNKDGIHIFDFQATREFFLIHNGTAYVYNYGNGSWYIYEGFDGQYFSVSGSILYIANGSSVYAFGDGIGVDADISCTWESHYITNSQNSGFCDIVGFDADVYVCGPIQLEFALEKSGGERIGRKFEYPEGYEGFSRISFRPSMKRAMPFRLTFGESGKGHCTLHGVNIKTREKERSRRNGIL